MFPLWSWFWIESESGWLPPYHLCYYYTQGHSIHRWIKMLMTFLPSKQLSIVMKPEVGGRFLVSTNMISSCSLMYPCGVFKNRVLPSNSGWQPRIMTITHIIWQGISETLLINSLKEISHWVFYLVLWGAKYPCWVTPIKVFCIKIYHYI